MGIGNKSLVFAFFIFLWGFAIQVNGDEWFAEKKYEVFSEDGKYKFVVIPNAKPESGPGSCKGVLMRVDSNNATEVWSRYLINNVMPLDAFVTNSGEYVVTMDEYHQVGDFPVVIYDRGGRVNYVHNIESLTLREDLEHISRSVSSFWWSEDSISFFDADEAYFIIRLHWGKILAIELHTGRVYKKSQSYANKMVRQNALSYLSSPSWEERKTGALVAGQMKITEAIPKLRELLKDRYWSTTSIGNEPEMIYFDVRKAAKDALEAMGEKAGDVIIEIKEEGNLYYNEEKNEYMLKSNI